MMIKAERKIFRDLSNLVLNCLFSPIGFYRKTLEISNEFEPCLKLLARSQMAIIDMEKYAFYGIIIRDAIIKYYNRT